MENDPNKNSSAPTSKTLTNWINFCQFSKMMKPTYNLGNWVRLFSTMKWNGNRSEKNPENLNNYLIRVRLFNDSPALFGPILTPLHCDTRYLFHLYSHIPCVVHRVYKMKIDKIIDNLIKNIGFSIFAVIKDSLSSLIPSNNSKRQSD